MFGGLFGSGPERVGGDGQNTLSGGAMVHLALYKTDSCGFCRRVFRVIDELDVQVEYRDLNASVEHRKALREQTGRTTVPCLLIDGTPMFESADIVDWLRETFPR